MEAVRSCRNVGIFPLDHATALSKRQYHPFLSCLQETATGPYPETRESLSPLCDLLSSRHISCLKRFPGILCAFLISHIRYMPRRKCEAPPMCSFLYPRVTSCLLGPHVPLSTFNFCFFPEEINPCAPCSAITGFSLRGCARGVGHWWLESSPGHAHARHVSHPPLRRKLPSLCNLCAARSGFAFQAVAGVCRVFTPSGSSPVP
jgi:hypothetical protein